MKDPIAHPFIEAQDRDLEEIEPETIERTAVWGESEGDDDYRMQHRPPDRDGTPIHDMTHNFAADIYTHPHYYSDMSDPTNVKAHNVIQRVRNKPDANVHIYRALPAEHVHQGFRPGDWVSTSKEYAMQHGRHATDPKHDWPVIHTMVKAKDLHTDGDDFREYGYNGTETKPGDVTFGYKGGYHQEVSDRAEGGVRSVQRRANPTKGYSFTHEPQSWDGSAGRINAWDHNENYAGHALYWHGKPDLTHIEPEHQEHAEALTTRMHKMIPPYTAHEGARTAVQAPPEGLSFTHDDIETGGSKHPIETHLRAIHPEHGQVGAAIYFPPKRRDGRVVIRNLHVENDQRRQGIGSALMDEIQRRHPDSSIDHGDRTADGENWWSGYTQGKPVRRGRTALVTHPDEGEDSPYERTAGRSEGARGNPPRGRGRDRGAQQGPQEPVGAQAEGDLGGRVAPAARELVEHTKVKKDLAKLQPRQRALYADRVEGMLRGDRHSSTHPLHGPLKGWEATDIDSQARITHRVEGDDLIVGHVGPHNYDDAAQRLGAAHDNGLGRDWATGNAFAANPPEEDKWGPRVRDHTAPNGTTYRMVHQNPTYKGSTVTVHAPMKNGGYRGVGYLGYTSRPDEGPDVSEIYKTHVHPDHQRQGLASAMLDFARESRPGLRHSPALTDDGKAWSEKVGATQTHWHVSDSRNRDSIAENGLDLAHSSDGRHIWLHGDEDEARAYQQMGATRDMHGNPVTKDLYRVDTTGIRTSKEPHGVADIGQRVVKQSIPPERIKRVGVRRCPCGTPVRRNGDEWEHADGSVSHDGEFYGKSVADLMRTAARYTPTKRVFTHTDGLDHRLFDADGHLRPEVRTYVLKSIAAMWILQYRNWSQWARIYFAGSEASEWTSETLEGNDDFDVLVGVDYVKCRDANAFLREMSNQEITDRMNQQFRAFNGPVMLEIDGSTYGPFDRTTYVNPDSYDIKRIKPYAAYDVGADEWVVKPPHLPHWSIDDLPKPVVRVLRAAESYAKSVLKLPEPERTQQGAALFEAWHSDRSRAFSDKGEGWFDIANLREKWGDQEGWWAELTNCAHRAKEGLDAAPADWSSEHPFGLTAARRDPHHGDGPFYHGTGADLAPGDELRPGDEGEKSHGKFSDGSKVWVSNDPVRAAAYGHRLYEVTPHSRPRSPYANHDEHHTTGATVVREVPYDEARTLSQARTASRTDDAYGSNDVDSLFKGNPTTSVPFQAAGRSKKYEDYDKSLVHAAIAHPEHHQMQDVDPRELRATQPSVTRAGVQHYLGHEYEHHGTTFADQGNPGNARPIVYHREDGQKILLSGHHRGTAALLQGRPLQAVVVQGPYGKVRGT